MRTNNLLTAQRLKSNYASRHSRHSGLFGGWVSIWFGRATIMRHKTDTIGSFSFFLQKKEAYAANDKAILQGVEGQPKTHTGA